MLEDARSLAPSAVDIPPPELHEAVILDSATKLGEAVRCTVASLDPLLATDPMPWQPTISAAGVFYPKKDDRALLAYQQDGAPLIVWWEPSAVSPDAELVPLPLPNAVKETFANQAAQEVASGLAISVSRLSSLVKVTGALEIKKVVATAPGHLIVLKFASTPKVVDGENLKLNGNFEPTAESTLTLICDGTNWFEVARSKNT